MHYELTVHPLTQNKGGCTSIMACFAAILAIVGTNALITSIGIPQPATDKSRLRKEGLLAITSIIVESSASSSVVLRPDTFVTSMRLLTYH